MNVFCRRIGSVALAISATGCCVSAEKARAMWAEVKSQNHERAELAMRKTAQSLGAEVVAVDARGLDLPHWCESTIAPEIGPETRCLKSASDDGRSFRIVDDRGEPRLFVPVRSPAWPYSRLARRGNTLFVLLPRVSRRRVDEATRCECNRSYGYGYEEYLPKQFGFVVDDMPLSRVEEIEVPLTEDYINWRCKVIVIAAKGGGGLATCVARREPLEGLR